MYRLIFALCILGCSLAQFNHRRQYNQYNPVNNFNHYNRFNKFNHNVQPNYYNPPAPKHSVVVETPRAPEVYDRRSNYIRSYDNDAVILKSSNDVSPDGHFQYSYETSNGIAAQAVGTPKNFGGVPPNTPTVVEGSFSWVAPDGTPVSIGYVADEYGYRAVGDAIPTPPPIPKAILRSLQYQGVNIDNLKK